MESLSRLEDYIRRFHAIDFSEFKRIYNRLYSDYEDLQNRIEFSLWINSSGRFNLRFGLFKLYDREVISSFLKESGYEILNLDENINFAETFAPEMAFGFDYSKKNSRLKIYLLRLPDNPEFNIKPIKAIKDFLKINHIETYQISGEELNDCYILGIDFYKVKQPAVKLYSRRKDADFVRTKEYLEQMGVHSRCLEQFLELFSKGIFKDTTISKKYSREGFEGLSMFFEVANNSNQHIERMIEESIPNRFKDFKSITNVLEFNAPIKYSHIGLTFSEKGKKEYICVYFSPVFEVQK